MSDPAAFTLRPAAPDDRAAMGDLWVASWAATLPEIDFEARRPWLMGHLDALDAGGALARVAVEASGEGAGQRASRVAGFVVIHPQTGYLDQIAVGPDFRGTGAAEALIAEAKAISPALVALDVNQENPRAVRFYEKMGLAIVSEGKNPASGRLTFRMEWRPLREA